MKKEVLRIRHPAHVLCTPAEGGSIQGVYTKHTLCGIDLISMCAHWLRIPIQYVYACADSMCINKYNN
jgi:hypothetical protein